jgi:phage terminase small subunit
MPAVKNAKHEAVIQAYIADKERVGSKAYRTVYPKSSERAAAVAWSRLLTKADFKARIDELLAAVTAAAVQETGVTVARVVDELAKIGFANMQDYITVDDDGQPFIDLSKVSRDQAAAIQEITVETRFEGEDREAIPVRKVKFKLGDKRATLHDLLDHLGGFKKKVEVEHSGPGGKPIETKDVTPRDAARRIAFLLSQATIAGQAPQASRKKKGK